ncbi:hypothetical protein AAG570_004763 [Ranatra chinensis]|uniref:Major facilitator superfamily (MFS) profile domain-containing protein n=1 Tax=Ranatra chinensis TaxID=642074 RepID=A0ABD0Y1T6_9HEMI
MPEMLGPHSEVPMTEEQLSWVVAAIEVGDIFTPIPCALLADRFGRKPVLLSTGPCYLVAWLVILETRSVPGLYLARFIQGMAIGITYSVLPIYLGEIASPKYRGSLGILDIYSWYLGVFFEYSIGPFLSYNAVMWASLAEAEGALRWLRGGADGAAEMEEVLQEVKLAREGASLRCGVWTELMGTRKGLSSLGLAAAVLLSCLMGGLSTLLSYTSLVFSPGQEVLCSIVLGVLLLLTVPLFGRLFDCWGRRPVYLLSSAICCVCALIIGN